MKITNVESIPINPRLDLTVYRSIGGKASLFLKGWRSLFVRSSLLEGLPTSGDLVFALLPLTLRQRYSSTHTHDDRNIIPLLESQSFAAVKSGPYTVQSLRRT